MPQMGFLFDQTRCIGCQICTLACKSYNSLPPGPVRWVRMIQWEKDPFPQVSVNPLWVPCYHCQNPVCVDVANGALIKESKYGAVLVDPAKATSASLRAANQVCPYGAIAFDSDAPNATASKCTMCVDRLEQGLLPVCVISCPTRALDFGTLSDLQKKYSSNSNLAGLPDSSGSNPSVVFIPKTAKKQLVSYDSARALTLLATRGSSLPPVFGSASDVTTVPDGLVGKSKPLLHPNTSADLVNNSQDDSS